MKKFYYLSMVCFILSMVSCSDDETVYSCDKKGSSDISSDIGIM